MTIIYASGEQKGTTIPTNYDFSLADDLILMGTEAQQPVNLGAGDDQLIIQGDGNTVNGGLGNDFLDSYGPEGTGNTLNGDEGNDTILGGTDDTLDGGSGRDVIYAGRGNNTITGGTGRDIFIIANAEMPTSANTITDFDPTLDVIGISLAPDVTAANQLIYAPSGDNTTISFGGTDIAIVNGSVTADNVVIIGDGALEPLPNTAPVVDDATLEFDRSPNVGEVIGTVIATDPDEDEIASYAITGGTGANFFTFDPFDPSTGVITISATDGLTAGLTLDITATDALGLTSEVRTFTVGQDTITNTAPVLTDNLPTLRYKAIPEVGDNIYAPTDYTLATDPEGDTLTYTETNDFFDITVDGKVVIASIDGLTGDQTLNFTAKDGDLTSAALSVTIKQNIAPTVNANQTFQYDATPASTDPALGTVVVTDADDTTGFTYAITGGTGAELFNINANGEIFIDGNPSTATPDALTEAQLALLTPDATFNLTIEVTDPLGDTGTGTVDITGAGAFNLDVDGNGSPQASRDAALINQYMVSRELGFTLTNDDITGLFDQAGERNNATAIIDHLQPFYVV